jgi:transposase-like protein
MKSLPRKAKKRNESSEKRGVNNEHVCVLTAIDSNDQLLFEVIDQGNPKTENTINTLDGRIQMNQTIITDSKSAYIEVAKKFKATLHQIPSGFHRNGQYHLGDINEVHSRLKTWLSKFKGISTKHLNRYLAWFRFKRRLDYQFEVNYHNRITMNHSIRELISFLIKEIHSTPFPIDIYKPYS